MEDTVQRLLAPGKGILAADESTHTITKRFGALSLISTPELNKKYRQMLFTTPGIESYLGGIILFDETVHQSLYGKTFPEYIASRGIVPGIKVDEGLEPFNGTGEQVTKGLEGLPDRLKKYLELGLKFTKWRAAISISDIFPTDTFLQEDMERLTKFAVISQESGFVPIVEAEILLDGTHTATRCEEISIKTWRILFEKLNAAKVDLKNLLLKTSMVLPGKESGVVPAPFEVAQATLRALKSAVPPEVFGIVFLSGGQTPEEATANLNEIVKEKGDAPWQISFSYARALQEEAMAVWLGKDENVDKAQEIFLKRLTLVSKARNGQL
jgi:fructose-bisphosphate aldolase class I